MTDDEEDLDIRLGDLPEVRPYGVPGFLVTSLGEDGEPDYDRYMDAAYEYESHVIAEGIREQSEERARRYLSEHGDAVWGRVEPLLGEAEALLPDHPGASLTVCLTAAELIIRFLLLRPLLGGLIFDDRLAERLAREASTGRTRRDHEILPMVNEAWQLSLDRLKIENGTLVWPRLEDLWRLRDYFVHRGDGVSEADAREAILCTMELVSGLVELVAARLHMTWPEEVWLEPFDIARDPFVKPQKAATSSPKSKSVGA